MTAFRRRDLLLGLDLGQAADFTALVVAERRGLPEPAAYDIGHIERWRGVRYPLLVEIVKARCAALAGQGAVKPTLTLVIDHTGVGRPVFDMFLAAGIAARIVGVTITSGQAVTTNDDGFGVPKRLLASTLQVLLQSGRLRIHQSLQLAADLHGELQNFKVKISLSGHDSYGAGADWRDGNHDDLVLGAALALWFGEGAGVKSKPTRASNYLDGRTNEDDWEDRKWMHQGQ